MPTDKKRTTRGAAAEDTQDRRILPERRAAKERRSEGDRRRTEESVAVERRNGRERRDTGDGDRRKVERRINEYPLKPEVLEFINAINEFKSVNQKPFPTWTEIYEILLGLGYRKS